MNSEKQKELRSLFIDGLRFQKEKRDRLDTMPRVVSPGELFLFPVDMAVKWCTTFTHSKDDELWYIVPGDEFPEVGTRDVVLPDSCDESPLVFRCGNGIWVHLDDFDFDQRIGQIDRQYVEQIRDHLGRIVKNDLPTVDSLVETDDDPDYIEWIEELSAAVQEFEEQLLRDESAAHGEERTILPSTAYNFGTDWMAKAGIESTALAADAAGINEVPRLDSELAPIGAVIDFEGPGVLVAIQYPTEIVFQVFRLENKQTPPEIVANGDKLDWFEMGAYWATDEVQWSGNLIEFSINGEKQLPIER